MLQLVNLTQLASERALLTAVDGQHALVVVVKATFDLKTGARPQLSKVQEPVIEAPLFLGEDPNATILRDAELTLDHPGTDVVVNGCAHAPAGRPASVVLASVQVGPVQAKAQVTGPRNWVRGLLGVVPDTPATFEKMPITYENAFGGGQETDQGRIWDMRNPAGSGFASDPGLLIGTPAPTVEDPDSPVTRATAKANVPIAGFSAQPVTWTPRRDLGGTYDAAWQDTRMPFWPDDVQPGYFRVATPALQSQTVLQGHEQVRLRNMTPEGLMEFRLPRLIPTVRTQSAGRWSQQEVNLRRVIIEPDLGKLVMMWRSVCLCGADGRKIKRISVDQKRIVRADTGVAA